MNFVESVNDTLSICPFEQFNSVYKEALNICLWASLLLLCLVLYVIIYCIKYISNKFHHRFEKITPRFQTCSVQLLLLSYIPVSTSLFHLINCVKIYDNGYFDILYTQGDILCYQPWQWFVIAFICLWTAPFVISIYIGISLLKNQLIKTRHFFVTLIFPLSAVYFLVKFRNKNNGKDKSMELNEINRKMFVDKPQEDIIGDNEDFIDEKEASLRESNTERIIEEEINENNTENIHGTSDEKESRAVYRKTSNREMGFLIIQDTKMNGKVSKETSPSSVDGHDMLQMLQGSFKYKYWLSIQKLRNIILVIVFTFVDNIIQRLYVMAFVLMLSLIIHFINKPYKEPVMNWLESSLLTMLILLNAMSIFDSMQFYGIPETSDIIRLRNSFHVVKVMILILPAPLLLLYIIIHKYLSPILKIKEDNAK